MVSPEFFVPSIVIVWFCPSDPKGGEVALSGSYLVSSDLSYPVFGGEFEEEMVCGGHSSSRLSVGRPMIALYAEGQLTTRKSTVLETVFG
jgi:hypothetical protein